MITTIWKFLKKFFINKKNEINIKGDRNTNMIGDNKMEVNIKGDGSITQIGNNNTASINNSISKRDKILNKIQNSKREDWNYEERGNKNFSLFNEKEQIIISHCPPIIKKRREILIKVLEEWYEMLKEISKLKHIDKLTNKKVINNNPYFNPIEKIPLKNTTTIKELVDKDKTLILEKIMDICVKKLRLFEFNNTSKVVYINLFNKKYYKTLTKGDIETLIEEISHCKYDNDLL